MDSEAYLNRIAASNRKIRNNGNSILSSFWFKILIAVTAAVLLLIIMSNILGSGETTKDKLISLKQHVSNLSSSISSYQPRVKSSVLRSNAASLNGVLTNTAKDLSEFITEKYKTKDDEKTSASIKKKEDELTKKRDDELFNARINGLLDRTFASKMAYEITVVSTREKEILKLTKNESLKNILETSLNSLDNLYNNFNNYSETR